MDFWHRPQHGLSHLLGIAFQDTLPLITMHCEIGFHDDSIRGMGIEEEADEATLLAGLEGHSAYLFYRPSELVQNILDALCSIPCHVMESAC